MRSNGYGGLNMPHTRKILIVDDDPQLRDALTEQLSLHEEFETAAAENGTQGVQVAKEGQIDLVIMDVGLPDIDGREAVRILRRKGFKAPIIMLTGHDADSDTILGLESGVTVDRDKQAQIEFWERAAEEFRLSERLGQSSGAMGSEGAHSPKGRCLGGRARVE